jgi:hypothetical protein
MINGLDPLDYAAVRDIQERRVATHQTVRQAPQQRRAGTQPMPQATPSARAAHVRHHRIACATRVHRFADWLDAGPSVGQARPAAKTDVQIDASSACPGDLAAIAADILTGSTPSAGHAAELAVGRAERRTERHRVWDGHMLRSREMKKLLAIAALVVLLTGGSQLSGTQSASAESPRACLGAYNMVGATPEDSSTWNPGMVHAMTVNNPHGNDGMFHAGDVSTYQTSQTPPCQV